MKENFLNPGNKRKREESGVPLSPSKIPSVTRRSFTKLHFLKVLLPLKALSPGTIFQYLSLGAAMFGIQILALFVFPTNKRDELVKKKI